MNSGSDSNAGDNSEEEIFEVIEGNFNFEGTPQLRVRNVSGRTNITVGPDREVHVVARKRARASSPEKAKRLLRSLEVRMEQSGDELDIGPHLPEQDRNWLDLFRGGRVSVDFEITVPRNSALTGNTVSGDLAAAGMRGPVHVRSVSGDLSVSDVQGSMIVKTVSGDAKCRDCCCQIEANSVSGDLSFERCTLRSADVTTVSGDVSLDGDLESNSEHSFKTISGDVDLGLAGQSYEVNFRTMTGSLSLNSEGKISRSGIKERTVEIGAGETQVRVKTISGSLDIRRAVDVPVANSGEHRPGDAMGSAGTRDGETSRGATAGTGREPLSEALKGRVLRIEVISGGATKVNIAIPLAIARMGKAKIVASGFVKGHLAKFGIDLDELLQKVDGTGTIVDVSDDEDRVRIVVE